MGGRTLSTSGRTSSARGSSKFRRIRSVEGLLPDFEEFSLLVSSSPLLLPGFLVIFWIRLLLERSRDISRALIFPRNSSSPPRRVLGDFFTIRTNPSSAGRILVIFRSGMALFPAPSPKNKPSWKLLPVLILVVFSLGFLLFRDSKSPSVATGISPQQQVVLVPVKNTLSVPMTVEHLPQDLVSALVHYASSETTPQQTREEIMMTAKVLASRGPCNFLVFGLGHDSLLWKTLNYNGRTVFLEESEDWVREVTEKHPGLETQLVEYSTVLTEAEQLMGHARSSRHGKCKPVQNLLLSECKLALNGLANEIFQVEWDVIMVDAPRGYFPQAPGRMSAIFSAAVMARSRKTGNGTDVFVHDVERPVERSYSEEFLCRENLVEESRSSHLWHFRVLPGASGTHEFCRTPAIPTAS